LDIILYITVLSWLDRCSVYLLVAKTKFPYKFVINL